MIVNRADRFGLAQLYQLRGRIGRSRERAFCYLVVPEETRMTPEAKQRLAVLQRFTELGAGFQVATHDLEIRGAGELLGERQHGAGRRGRLRDLRQDPRGGGRRAARRAHQARVRSRDHGRRPGVPARRLRARHRPAPRLLPAPGAGARRGRRARHARRAGGPLRPAPRRGAAAGRGHGRQDPRARLGALAYELGGARRADARARHRLDPAQVLKLVQAKGSRWKLSPDMRLAYTFTEHERADRLGAARWV